MPKKEPKKSNNSQKEVEKIEIGPKNPVAMVDFVENPKEPNLKLRMIPVDQLHKWDKNPRNIKAVDFEKLKRSLEKNPGFMQKRPLLVNETKGKYVVYAGNMRLAAIKALGWPEAPCIVEKDIPTKRMNEEALKDNIEYGQWDMDLMSENFSEEELKEMELPDREMGLFELGKEDFEEDMDLPTGDKNPFQQMVTTLATAQAEMIYQAISDCMKTEEYKYMETHGNQNSNGNALSLIVEQWAQQKI